MYEKQIQLFILPYAGGSIASFKRLTDLLDDRIDVVTVEYPGRGTRAKEPLVNTMDDLLNDTILYCQKRRYDNLPYSVMGYSMGSILAYEMLSRSVIQGDLKHLFISAEVSPKERSLELRQLENPTEERILARARQLGGLDERLLKSKRFANIYIKPMLSDYRLFFEYRFQDNSPMIKADTTFFYCEKDTSLSDVKKWKDLIDGKFIFHEYGDNHFFINQYYEEMAKVINETLCQ